MICTKVRDCDVAALPRGLGTCLHKCTGQLGHIRGTAVGLRRLRDNSPRDKHRVVLESDLSTTKSSAEKCNEHNLEFFVTNTFLGAASIHSLSNGS